MKEGVGPIARDLVLVGGGHSHAIALKMLAMTPIRGVRITLVSDTSYAPYSGMLPGYIAGCYSFAETHIDLPRLATFAGASFIRAEVTGLDLDQRKVLLNGRPDISFDILSINIGSTPPLDEIPGAREFTIPVKPVPKFLTFWQKLLNEHPKKPRSRIVIVGGGAGGVELAFAFRARLGKDQSIHLVQNGPEILPTHTKMARILASRYLTKFGIEVTVNASVVAVESDAVCCDGNFKIPFDNCIWATGASAPEWIRDSGLEVDKAGFIKVSDTLQSVSDADVFAVGDIASLQHQPRPKSGVFAVRQGQPLFDNLTRILSGENPASIKLQRQFLSLIGTGDGSAIASRGCFAISGRLMWRVKEWIDRRFMRKFEKLPQSMTLT